jgi:Ca2+-binding EF-hand superfamily protein
MSSNTARGLFNKIDADGDGKIDQNKFSQWVKNGGSGGAIGSSSGIIKDNFSIVSHGGADFKADASYGSDANAVFDRMDLNHDNVIDRREFNQFIRGESADADRSSITNYVSKYPTDGRGFYLDPNPEIITRPNPDPAPIYTQNIIIRYLQPPPLPPLGVSYFFVTLLFALSIKN